MTLPFYTIGHSTRTIEAFVELLRAGRVSIVADIRSVPRSRTNPQFNTDTLPEALAEFQIGYEHLRVFTIMRTTLSPPHSGAGSTG